MLSKNSWSEAEEESAERMHKEKESAEKMRGKSVTVVTEAATLEGGKKSEATPRSAKAARSESQTAGELWHETDTT